MEKLNLQDLRKGIIFRDTHYFLVGLYYGAYNEEAFKF